MNVVLFALVLGTFVACLSNPTPHPAADTTQGVASDATTETNAAEADSGETAIATTDTIEGDASAADGDVDDGADGEVSDAASEPFPPVSRTIWLRDVVVTDLDGDGFDDVVLTNAPDAAPEDWGVWVMLGGAERVALDEAERFVATLARPDQVLRTALIDGADWELAVLGATGSATDAPAWLEIFPRARGDFGAPLRRQTSAPQFGFTPRGGSQEAGQPVILASLDLTGDGSDDLLLGDLYRLIALHPTPWSEEGFGPDDHTDLRVDPIWNAILQALPVRSGADRWLAVLQQDMSVRYLPIGEGGIDPDAEVAVDLSDDQGVRNTIISDVDDDDVPDVTSVFLDVLSVIRFTPPTATLFTLTPNPTTSDGTFEDVAVGDVDGSGKPDIVLLDQAPGTLQSALVVVRDPRLDSGAIFTLKDLARRTLPIGQHPRHLAVGHFGGDSVSVWTFDDDGTPRCSRWSSIDERLASCPP